MRSFRIGRFGFLIFGFIVGSALSQFSNGGGGGGGGGTVTNTGPLTANKVIKGNGGVDVTASGCDIDSSNNVTCPGTISSGSGGGATGGIDLVDSGSGFKVSIDAGTLTADRAIVAQDVAGDLGILNGSFSANDCLKYSSAGKIVTAGAACGSGSSGLPFGPTISPAPTVGSLTWVNQGTATAANQDSLLTMQDTGNNGNMRLLKTAASNANFTFTAWILPTLPNVQNTRVGICMRESGTGKIQDLMMIGGAAGGTGTIVIDRWTDATNFAATIQNGIPVVSTATFGTWLRMQYNGTNVISFVSGDGEFWYQINSTAATTSFTTAPDEFGACISPSNGSSAPVAESVISWVES